MIWVALVLVFLLAVNIDGVFSSLCFYVFQSRDLHRAAELLDGRLIFYGPEMTGGGHLPGPLYYFLLAGARLIHPEWESAWYLLLAFTGLAAVIGWWYFQSALRSQTGALLFFALFALAVPTQRYLQIFLNVSYALPFAVAAVALLALSFTHPAEAIRRRALVATGLVLGLALQLHFSLIFLALAAGASEALAPRLGLIRHRPAALLAGIAAFILPSLPYLAWSAAGADWGQAAFYSGSGQGALPSLIHMMDYITHLDAMTIVRDVVFRLIETLPAPLLALVAARARHPHTPAERVFLVAAAFGFIPFSYWFFADIGVRYSIPFYVPLLFYTSSRIARLIQSGPIPRGFIVACAILLTAFFAAQLHVVGAAPAPAEWLRAIGLLAAIVAAGFAARIAAFGPVKVALGSAALVAAAAGTQLSLAKTGVFYTNPQNMPRMRHWSSIWNSIHAFTGWSYEDASRRIFYLNHHIEQEPRFGYSRVRRMTTEVIPATSPPDGFFVALRTPARLRGDAGRLKGWIIRQAIPPELADALNSGAVVLDAPLMMNPLVVAYRVVDAEAWPSRFHNLGQGYLPGPEQKVLETVAGTEGAAALDDGRLVFKWNECPGHHAYCTTGAVVEADHRPDGLRLRVDVLGSAISQVSPWIAPDWTQAWIAPYIEVLCDGAIHRREIAKAIGYRREYAVDKTRILLRGNNSLVAPFAREFHVECRNPPAEITVGRESSTVENLYAMVALPAKRLTIDRRRSTGYAFED